MLAVLDAHLRDCHPEVLADLHAAFSDDWDDMVATQWPEHALLESCERNIRGRCPVLTCMRQLLCTAVADAMRPHNPSAAWWGETLGVADEQVDDWWSAKGWPTKWLPAISGLSGLDLAAAAASLDSCVTTCPAAGAPSSAAPVAYSDDSSAQALPAHTESATLGNATAAARTPHDDLLRAFLEAAHSEGSSMFAPGRHTLAGVDLATWAQSLRADPLIRAAAVTPSDCATLEELPDWTWDPDEALFRVGYRAVEEIVAIAVHTGAAFQDPQGRLIMPGTASSDEAAFILKWVAKPHRLADLGLSQVHRAALSVLPGWPYTA